MGYYVKKPVMIEAEQWDGTAEDATRIIDWVLGDDGTARYRSEGPYIAVDTLEGTMAAMPEDFIIKGVKGEFYPCKPDIFKATYREATDEDF